MTLIEVVAALGIIAVGLVSLLSLFPVAIDASARAGDHTTAAILGEYVIEQVRLRQGDIEPNDDTDAALTTLEWGRYLYKSKWHTFDATTNTTDDYGSGEQIVEQSANDLTDQELYSRFEVTLEFGQIDGTGVFNDAGNHALMQVTVTVRWPRASSDAERDAQKTMTFVTYIRPQP